MRQNYCTSICAFTFERLNATQIDVGNVCNVTEVIGQNKASTVMEPHSIVPVSSADIAYELNELSSECACRDIRIYTNACYVGGRNVNGLIRKKLD